METVCALPPVETALDQLIKLYGVETVAEVTGRGRRVVVGVNIPTIPNAKVSVSRYDFSSDVTEKTGNKFRGEYDKSDQNNLHHFGNNSDDKTYTANTVKVWDKRYNEVKRINEVYVEKRLKQIIEIENHFAVEWDTSFDVAVLVTGVKGGAKVTYSILDDDNTEASINDETTGVISGTTQPGAVKAKISIAATNKYAATSREIDVEFTTKESSSVGSHGIPNQTSVKWGTAYAEPVHPLWWKVADHGNITYKADSLSATAPNFTCDTVTVF